MVVRNANIDDANSVRQISLDSSISRNSNEITGFVEFETPSEEEYKIRIKDNPFFYVAEENGEIIGFLANYTNDFLKRLKLDNDEIMKHILVKPFLFIYSEQVAVTEKYRMKNVAQNLYKKFFNDARTNGYKIIYGVVSHHPIRNIASIKLVEKLGFREIQEIKVYDGLVFGAYRKDL